MNRYDKIQEIGKGGCDHIEEVEKFNPYHDARGRFASAQAATSFTIRTRDAGKQSMADKAKAREKERTAAASPAKAPKNTRQMETVRDIEARIRKQGYESAAIVDKDGNTLMMKDGARDHVGFTKQQIEMMRGNVLTHNHPGSTMFSPEDIQTFVNTGMTGIRAAGRNGTTYSISQGEGYSQKRGEEFSKAFGEATRKARGTAQTELDNRGYQEKIMRGIMHPEMANMEFGKVMTGEMVKWTESNAKGYGIDFSVETGKVRKSEEPVKKSEGDGDEVIVLDRDFEQANRAAFEEWLHRQAN